MARRDIQFLPGNYYHIYNRGNNQQEIFLEDDNYRYFLKRLSHYYQLASVEVVAFCLMPNHFHLLVTLTKEIDFSNVMRSFSVSYVKSFNEWHKRAGHLFQGDFQSKRVDSDEYLLHVCRYIHLNPVKSNLTDSPQDWLYSDYQRWVEFETKPKFHGFIKNTKYIQLRNSLIGSAADYKKFVGEYAEDLQMQERIKSLLFGK